MVTRASDVLGKKGDPVLDEVTGRWDTGDVVILKAKIGELRDNQVVDVVYEIGGTVSTSYIAIGFRTAAGFRHSKQIHAPAGEVFRMSIAPDDLAIKLDSGWEVSSETVLGVEYWVKIKEPCAGTVRLLSVDVHEVTSHNVDAPSSKTLELCTELMAFTGLGKFDNAAERAQMMLDRPVLFVGPNSQIDLTAAGQLPDGYGALANSDRYMLHALGHVRILLIGYLRTKSPEMLAQARKHAEIWIRENFDTAPSDQKYAYYDHGAAERLIVLLSLWVILSRVEAASTDRQRILDAAQTHARLVGSWSFANKNQPYFIHNHAIFQAVASIGAGLVLQGHSEREHWIEYGLNLVHLQMDGLVSDDGVSIENSTAYHLGLCNIVQNALRIFDLAGLPRSERSEQLNYKTETMRGFAERVQFTPGRMPATGDSKYSLNRLVTYKSSDATDSCQHPSLLVFPKSGYGSIKGETPAGVPISILMSAPALSLTHKHDDDLSISVATADGIEWICDPGFHAYDTSQPSEYARSPEAHNAPFLRDRPYLRQIGLAEIDRDERSTDDTQILSGKHNHYVGMTVSRTVTWRNDARKLEITDVMVSDTDKNCSFELGFLFGDGVEATQGTDGTIRLNYADLVGPKILSLEKPFRLSNDGRVFPVGRIIPVNRASVFIEMRSGRAEHRTLVSF